MTMKTPSGTAQRLGWSLAALVLLFQGGGPELGVCVFTSPLVLLVGIVTVGAGLQTRYGQLGPDAVYSPGVAAGLGSVWPLLSFVPVGDYLAMAWLAVLLAVPYFSALLIARRRRR